MEAEGQSALIEVIDALITWTPRTRMMGGVLFMLIGMRVQIAHGEEYHEICVVVGHYHVES